MGVELRPLGVTCNITCQYCYQNPQRDAGNLRRRYDMAAMLQALEQEDEPFTVFGGEPLLMPIDDLERLWAFGLRRFGRNRIQTNGTLIDARHVELFRRYRVDVGISVDGPGSLNDARWVGSLERTRAMTARTHDAIHRLCAAGLPPNLIVTLHRGNALPQAWAEMDAWLVEVESLGIARARLHVLEVDHPEVGTAWAMSDAENAEAFLHFYRLEKTALKALRFDLFDEIRNLLLGDDRAASCVWQACDPYTTHAVHGVEGFGERSNCGRTNKLGIDFVKADTTGFERVLMLWATPQQDGGCAGCRFFAMCKGQCPGSAIESDWRNRSAQCALWMRLFETLEAELVDEGRLPLSLDPRRQMLENALLEAWSTGTGLSMNSIISEWPKPTG